MNRTILYYPTIDIPTNSWLRHAILYWDEVSSIVPKNWNDEIAIELSPDIQYLIAEGQFRPVRPEDLIINQSNLVSFEAFREEFHSIISSAHFQNFINRNLYSYRSGRRSLAERERIFSRIHANKVSDMTFYFLEEMGLATREDNYGWLWFEQNTALLYMSLLAKYLADIDINQTTIGTDYYTYEKFNFNRVSPENGFPVVSLNLDRVLPTPKDNVPLQDILKFKEKRADNLRHFKKMLSDFQSKVAKSESNKELKETVIGFRETLINGVDDLSKTLNDSKINAGFKTFKSLINLKSPTTLLSTGATLNEKYGIVNLPLDWTAIGIAAVGAIELTGHYIENSNQQRAKLRESPFSYLHYASKAKIVDRY